jgi:hypothetical protein
MMRLFRSTVRPVYVGMRGLVTHALFDRRYGVSTDDRVSRTDLGISDVRYGNYVPAGVRSLRRVIPVGEVTPDDVFVDFGSGKGRVVLQAAMHYPFRKVYGVELSEQLHDVAQANLEQIRSRLRCPDVQLIRSDVLDFQIPDDVTVAFLFNPFRGEVFQTVIGRLLESVDRHPRPLRIVYGNPVEETALLRTGRIRRVRALHAWRPGREWSRSNCYRLYDVGADGDSTSDRGRREEQDRVE